MSRIRPVTRDDLQQVASLYEAVMRSGGRTPPPLLAPYFERTWLDHPWADPEIPSLVYETRDGRIVGFVGSHVRRLRFDGRPVRMATPGPFVSDPEQTHHAAGALLLKRFLAGAQDITLNEGTLTVRRMWERLGGVALQSPSIKWTRLLRPAQALGGKWLERSGHARWTAGARPALIAADAAARRLGWPAVAEPSARAEPLTPQALVDHLPTVLRGLRVTPDYSEEFLRWLFDELAFVSTRGTLLRHLVRDEGRVLGWYVTYCRPGGFGLVMQIAAAADDLGAVIDRLFHEASLCGIGALDGRLEPSLYEPLIGRRCLLRHGPRVLAHSRDAELLAAVALGQAFVTRMDGDWWMGHQLEPFT